jgi:pimeloyl-ACP methyl ester carboxylesterase
LATYGLWEADDIHRWLDWLHEHENPSCVFGLGESMGAAQLLQSLKGDHGFCAVVAESSFSDFREIAYDRVGQFLHTGPWLGRSLLRPVVEVAFLRARWKHGLALENISPQQALARTSVPVLLIHGQQDGNIPIRHSRAIAAYNLRVVLWEVPGADHCGASSTAHAVFEQRLLDWYDAHSLATSARSRN